MSATSYIEPCLAHMKWLATLPLLAACAADDPAGPPPATPLSLPRPLLYQRLGDLTGPIPGMPGYSIEQTADATHCGGFAIHVVHAPGATVAPVDESFAKMLDVPPPTGLDFANAPETGKQVFDHWLGSVQLYAQEANARYEQSAKTGSPRDAVVASARMVQVLRMFASQLARFEIPADVATGDLAVDKMSAFCDTLATAAEPILQKAEKVAVVCAKKAETLAADWWTGVCR